MSNKRRQRLVANLRYTIPVIELHKTKNADRLVGVDLKRFQL